MAHRITHTPTTETRIKDIVRDRTISLKRGESLVIAAGLGADDALLSQLASVTRLARRATIVLPPLHYPDGLSRGRGWCRCGRGNNVRWGEKVDGGGYRVGPGRWIAGVGPTDGYHPRNERKAWVVRHLQVGSQVWTVAD